MRPSILDPLFADITSLRGVGPKIAPLIAKVAGPRLVDLVLTPPVGIVDRSYSPKIAEAVEDRLATLLVRVDRHQPPPKGKSLVPWRVLCSDETGFLTLIFFRPRADFLRRQLPEGEQRLISGKIEFYGSERQMAHPDYIVAPDAKDDLPLIEPVYPLTAGLAGKTMRRAAHGAVERAPDLPEWIDPFAPALEDWPTWHEAIKALHHPASQNDLSLGARHRRRLAYDELLANQLALALIRQVRRSAPGRAHEVDPVRINAAREQLGFALTGGQEHALEDILNDMAAPSRMVRLVQGDVGSGKTAVATLALIAAVSGGAQAAMMAPTEILARQHFESLTPICDALNISCVLVTGRDKGAQRTANRDGIRKGYAQIVVGTHALFSDDVAFADLGLVVIDEQHRFGVAQRLALQEKGQLADVLVMTATPIPRTLALTSYGDMETTQIREKPAGRKPIKTIATPIQKLPSVIDAVGRAIDKGEQVYWVCPLVSPSETIELISAEHRAETLAEHFGDAVGVVHGQMKGPEKDAVIESFYRGQLSVLVATTVIEVGVNAPNATVMVIEHAERFGLAQLHQLRGRVGRGDRASACVLLYHAGPGGLGETAKARLETLRRTEDGFEIAEEDLRLRGAGDSLGTVQSGFPQFRMADVTEHGRLLEQAASDAEALVRDDPDLKTKRGEALRLLLYLHARDEAVKLLRSG